MNACKGEAGAQLLGTLCTWMVQGEGWGGEGFLDNIAKVGGGHLVNSLEAYIEGSRQPTGVPPCLRMNSCLEDLDH